MVEYGLTRRLIYALLQCTIGPSPRDSDVVTTTVCCLCARFPHFTALTIWSVCGKETSGWVGFLIECLTFRRSLEATHLNRAARRNGTIEIEGTRGSVGAHHVHQRVDFAETDRVPYAPTCMRRPARSAFYASSSPFESKLSYQTSIH